MLPGIHRECLIESVRLRVMGNTIQAYVIACTVYMKTTFDGVMVSMLTSSAVDRQFETLSGQIKDL